MIENFEKFDAEPIKKNLHLGTMRQILLTKFSN